ncbi:helix-turn-helix transcriptional regulator [Reichenbachiella sp.]|uniref:helix-turn-helix domain-containing protein n=1 Tax=Reichenbachiella sp. TaxID=2184521 RepID=UPI0032652D8D
MDDVLKRFGQQVKKFRDQKGWSQEELAFRSGFHRTYIGRVERGERNLSLKNVDQIASTLDVSLSDIFNEI